MTVTSDPAPSHGAPRPPPAPAAGPPGRKPLASVMTNGRLSKPKRVLVYGPEGVGKTSFGLGAPKPVVLPTENGTDEFDVYARLPRPSSWEDALGYTRQLLVEDHDCQTLVVDTVSWLEPLIVEYICRRDNSKVKTTTPLMLGGRPNVDGYGYGHGWEIALEEWKIFLAELDRLRERRGMNVVLLAHAAGFKEKNPEGLDYGYIGPKLNKLASGLLCEWSDAVLYARFNATTIAADTKTQRSKVVSDGARVVFTETRGAFRAKNRYGLPKEMSLSWDEFHTAATLTDAQRAEQAGELKKQIAAALAQLDALGEGDVAKAARAWVDGAGGHIGRLREAHNRLATRVAAKQAAVAAAQNAAGGGDDALDAPADAAAAG